MDQRPAGAAGVGPRVMKAQGRQYTVRQTAADFNGTSDTVGKIHCGIVFRMVRIQGDINFPQLFSFGQEMQFYHGAGSVDRQPQESGSNRQVHVDPPGEMMYRYI